MKEKKYKIIYYFITSVLILGFTFFLSTIILSQTTWGREKIKKIAVSYAKKNNIDLKIEKIKKGIFPFEYDLQNVSIASDDITINIENLHFKIDLISLLQKKLTFKLFKANEIVFSSKDKIKKDFFKWPSFSMQIKFNKLKLINLKINDLSFNISGKVKLKKHGKTFFAKLKCIREEFKNSYLNILIKGYKNTKLIKTKANFYVANAKELKPLYKKDFDFAFDLDLDLKGSLDTYLAYFYKMKKNKYPNIENLSPNMKGYAQGNIYFISPDTKPILPRKSFFSFDLSALEDFSINISKAFFANDLFDLYLDAVVNSDFTLEKSNINIKIEDLKELKTTSLDLLGSFNWQINYEKQKILSDFYFRDLFVNKIPVSDFKGKINGLLKKTAFEGNLSSSAFSLNQTFFISSDLKFEKLFLDLINFNIKSASSNLNANLAITPKMMIIGDGKIHFSDLSQIGIFFPNINFNGFADFNFTFNQKITNDHFFQSLSLNGELSDFYINNFFGKKSILTINVDRPFSDRAIDLKLQLNDLKYYDLYMNYVFFEGSTQVENWPYKIFVEGKLKQNFEIESNGFWKINKNELILNIQDIKGFLFSHNFILPKPIKLEVSKNIFILSDLSIQLADSSLFADINFTPDISKAKVNLKHFPLDFLSINPLDLAISGFATLDFEIEKNKDLFGFLNMDIEEIKILALGDKAPLVTSGKIKSNIKNNYFNFDSEMHIKDTQFISCNGKIPFDIDLPKSLKVLINEKKDILLDIDYLGKAEEILDFIDIGPQRLEGDIKSELHISNKIKNLNINGYCSFKNGYFENYYTGTILKNIEAKFSAENDKIILDYLKGQDLDKGSFFASGIFSTSLKNQFPFYVNLRLNNLQCVDTDLINAISSAFVEISGNRLSSKAYGNITVDNLKMTIPDKLPIDIPSLNPIFFFHTYPKDVKEKKTEPILHPIQLYLDIDASKPIAINGKGLSSSWQGNFKMGGTYMNFETTGALQLIKGDYSFSSRHFNLTKGSVEFTGKPNEMPNLNIQAKMNLRGTDIIANIEGPLDTPKLFFRSKPPLPASSIMSLLIFGKELSEISEAQILELATMMSQKLDISPPSAADSVATLGINRFNVIDPSAPDQMASQLGKYITRGIVVSISQGEEQGSSNIIVEVDLKKGFVFQAETQQQQEQGKFSLKWRHNY